MAFDTQPSDVPGDVEGKVAGTTVRQIEMLLVAQGQPNKRTVKLPVTALPGALRACNCTHRGPVHTQFGVVKALTGVPIQARDAACALAHTRSATTSGAPARGAQAHAGTTTISR